jgi:hypothetical protein
LIFRGCLPEKNDGLQKYHPTFRRLIPGAKGAFVPAPTTFCYDFFLITQSYTNSWLTPNRVIENVIEKLIEWAAAALEMSSNQPVLPHAVIVLNASELSIDPGQWHVSQATKWLMDAVRGSIDKNLKFKRHAQMWRSRGKRIATVEDLLLSYYSSVRVVRVPGVGRPALMQSQMEKLYQEISSSLETSKMSKRSLRMLLDADELQPYLQFAFDHFAHNLDRAFDFVQASFVYSPIPSDFAGNILKLAVNMMELWENKLDGIGIFRELSFMVASCIMLDTARKKTRGWPTVVLVIVKQHFQTNGFLHQELQREYIANMLSTAIMHWKISATDIGLANLS